MGEERLVEILKGHDDLQVRRWDTIDGSRSGISAGKP